MLYYKGMLNGKKERMYEGKLTVHLQFVEDVGNGELDFRAIKVPPEINHTQFEIGQIVTVPVEIAVMGDKAYYRVTERKTGMTDPDSLSGKAAAGRKS